PGRLEHDGPAAEDPEGRGWQLAARHYPVAGLEFRLQAVFSGEERLKAELQPGDAIVAKHSPTEPRASDSFTLRCVGRGAPIRCRQRRQRIPTNPVRSERTERRFNSNGFLTISVMVLVAARRQSAGRAGILRPDLNP